ncbi:MAG: HEAT repeat domain-containing protein [Nostocaceae cyanobacterium]|nr:HEAT repeat domain-containing protein [Nostocaceae cyanobacterium]
MTKTNHLQFQDYLESISDKYKCWWNLYTLTDVEGKKRQEKQLSSPFDFGLIVETLQSKQAEEKQSQEKTERLPVLEGIRKYARNHVLLVGKPGSGKSTALARLLLEEAQAKLEKNSLGTSVNDTTIPILVELRYWQTSVFERIQAFLQQHDGKLNIDETTLKTLLRQGKFLLLIDGVNELPSADARRQVAVFRKDYPQTPMIFTTRDLGVGGDLGIEKKLEMQPLSETQMREFVMGYLPQQGEEMLQRLGDKLREFGKTPLLLWMLCGLFQQTGNIPPNLGMVFRLFTQGYENSDKLKRNVPVTSESRRWWKSLLENLAFVMMQGESVTEFRVAIPKEDVEEIFTKYLTAEKLDKPRDYAKCWLEDLLNYHLIQVGSGDKIEFRHQLLQEYYAAEYLLKQLLHTSDAKLQRDYLNLLKWTEPVALMLALVEDKTQALRVVQLGLDVDLMLGARLAGEVKPEFQKYTVDLILNKELPKSLETLLLSISRSEWAVDALFYALNDEDSSVRWEATSALVKIGSEKAVDTLINALNDEDSSVRKRVADALGQIGSKRAVDALFNALNHEDLSVRWRAADALGKIGSERAVDALINALNDEYSDVRRSAADALGQIGSERAVDALINALNDEYSYVRWSAADALRQIGSERAVDALINALNDEDSNVRWRAADALGKIGSERAVDALINALNDENLDVRRNAADALGKIGSERAIDVLVNALNDEYSSVRRSATDALGKIGSERAIDVLVNALNDEYSSVRRSATDALGKIGSERAVDALINALNDENLDVRRITASVLGQIAGSDKITKVWQFLLNDTYEAINIILNIQERCKFYNHDIFHSPPVEEDKKSDSSTSSTTFIFQEAVGNVNAGDTTITGNQIGIQKNQQAESKE